MKPVLALFELSEFDELSCELCDIETRASLARVEDDPSDRRPFQYQVKSAAAALGFEVVEWDRSALGR